MTVQMLKPPLARDGSPTSARIAPPRPAELEIDGARCAITRLAEDGSAEVAFSGSAERGQIIQGTLRVALDGFDLTIPTMWDVVGSIPESARLQLILAPLNGAENQALVHTVIHSILSGETLNSADVMELSRTGPEGLRESRAASQNHIRPASRTRLAVQRRAGAIIFVLLACALLAFIVASFATRALIVPANGTIVNSQAALVSMPEAGELVSYLAPVGARVAAGTPVAMAKNKAGQTVTFSSTCDCVIGGQLAPARTVLHAGEPILQLVPVESANKALLAVSLNDLRRVRVGDPVTATFYDSTAKVTGNVERISPPKVLGGTVARPAVYNGTVEIRFTNKLPAWRVGEPIIARIRLTKLNPFG